MWKLVLKQKIKEEKRTIKIPAHVGQLLCRSTRQLNQAGLCPTSKKPVERKELSAKTRLKKANNKTLC
jgi:hypothetical protein